MPCAGESLSGFPSYLIGSRGPESVMPDGFDHSIYLSAREDVEVE